MSRTCDVSCAVDHVVRFTRPSPSVFAYCKWSKTGAGEGLGMRLDWSQQTKETVYPSLFFPTLQMGRKSGLHSFSPSVQWKSESVPPTLFSHCNKMEKKSVPPTLFFPIIEGEKVQRVRNFTEPLITLELCAGHLALEMCVDHSGTVCRSPSSGAVYQSPLELQQC